MPITHDVATDELASAKHERFLRDRAARRGTLPVMMRRAPDRPAVNLPPAIRAAIGLEAVGRRSCGGSCPLPDGKTYRPHIGGRQRLRELKRSWQRFERLCAVDFEARSLREAVLDAVAETVQGQAQAELQAVAIVHGALCQADGREDRWVPALRTTLNQYRDAVETAKRHEALARETERKNKAAIDAAIGRTR